MDKTELRPAFFWVCVECGQDNFVRPRIFEASPEELEELKVDFGYQPWETGEFIFMPNTVKCVVCGETFEVENAG